MKKQLLIILAATLVMTGCQRGCTNSTKPSESGETAETSVPEEQPVDENAYMDFTAVTPDGKELSLSDLVGQTDYVLVDFWASWCGPCRRLIPVLKEIYAGQPKGRLQIFSCSVDQDENSWRTALREEQMPWPQAREDDEHVCSDLYGVEYIPFTVLIDRNGQIVAVNPDESDLEELLFAE